MSKTVAFLAECQGSATIDEQKASLALDDQIVLAGRRSFAKLPDLLAHNGMGLAPGDRVKVYDLSCINLSTTNLVRTLTKLLDRGVTFEIISRSIVIRPAVDDKLRALLETLDGHYRHVHGIKTHPVDTAPQGRKRLLGLDQLPDIRARLDRPGATATDVAQELGVARSTLFNYLERFDPARRVGRGQEINQRHADSAGDNAHVSQSKPDQSTT